ncbi:ANTAR domain-containing protein [Klenkia terrae]|uniref:ANTAR domain-containing protein n=1 Tax=Klenkia terrae TaxID=1052259 RepID=A0ABU8E3M8_9ACTN
MSSATAGSATAGSQPDDVVRTPDGDPAFVITRTTRGWAVVTPAGTEQAADLVEAMSLADLIAEDLGASPEPGRDARRAARGTAADEPGADPRDQQLAALQRSVGQLEHALAARVSVERAIGVLAVRGGSCPREAFEQLRREARSSGRPVHDLAREVLSDLGSGAPRAAVPAPAGPPPVESLPAPERPARRRVERSRARQPLLAEGEH